ncbi:MAG TPA: hypothetical protein VEB66_08485 [Opitutaceae bacterium]|nr:hypothetical protein [Opitutaceae bacterium]
MKDHRFIELVNLYIDRQISSAEAAELETELQANARRRQVYQQYCRMHRATQLVYESFRQEAGREAPQAGTKGGTLVRLEGARRRRDRWAYAFAGMAAAACVGLVVSRTILSVDETAPLAAGAPAALNVAAQPPARVPVELAPAAPAIEVRSPLSLETDYQAMLAAFQLQEASRGLAVPAKERSLFDDDVFGGRALAPGQPNPGRRGTSPTASEFSAAFQFQR